MLNENRSVWVFIRDLGYLRAEGDFHAGELGKPVPPAGRSVQDVGFAHVHDTLE